MIFIKLFVVKCLLKVVIITSFYLNLFKSDEFLTEQPQLSENICVRPIFTKID